jgi:hypothetical protein
MTHDVEGVFQSARIISHTELEMTVVHGVQGAAELKNLSQRL